MKTPEQIAEKTFFRPPHKAACIAAIREWREQTMPFLQHYRLLLYQLRGYDKEVAELDKLLEGLTHNTNH